MSRVSRTSRAPRASREGCLARRSGDRKETLTVRCVCRARRAHLQVVPNQLLNRRRGGVKLAEDARAGVRDEIGVLRQHRRHLLLLGKVCQLRVRLVRRTEDLDAVDAAHLPHYALDHAACDVDRALRLLLERTARVAQPQLQVAVVGLRLKLRLELANVVYDVVEPMLRALARAAAPLTGDRLGRDRVAIEDEHRVHAVVAQQQT
eukprot:6574176-Prymnesium_polylepis.2